MKTFGRKKWIYLGITACFVIALGIGAGYTYTKLDAEIRGLKDEKAKLTESLIQSKTDVKNREKDIADLTANLNSEKDTNTLLSQSLNSEQAKNAAFASQILNIASTVGTLKKLSETDRELLKKYSRVYFLSENYVPAKLSPIDAAYLFDKTKLQQFHSDALPFLMRMLSESRASSGTLEIVSAYRSFSDQVAVKSGYKFLYGSGANQFSADQGYSEHQLGTAIDFTVKKLDGLSLQLEKQPEYEWLANNAYRFGFVLSYPKNNGYYQFEPWHWRFVGIQLAKKLHDENKHFYDLTQRDIDSYLISIFDQ